MDVTGAGRLAERGLRLIAAHDADPVELLRFELDERAHFAASIPDRGDDYYDLDAVTASLAAARSWWEAGTDRLHVVVDPSHRIVARANLVDIVGDQADLGYRVAASWTGRGVATSAVRDLLAIAPRHGIRLITATTSADNVGSVRVLQRCGFQLLGTRAGAIERHGVAIDALDWAVRTDARPVHHED